MEEGDADPDAADQSAPRRTRFAAERTMLAWWRTGIAAGAVALAVGGLLPHLGDLPRVRFLALACGYGALAITFFVGGAIRDRQSRHALEHNSFAGVPDWVANLLTLYMSILVLLTLIALF